MADPERVLVAGDWHGNTPWARGVIELLPKLLPDESPRRIVHCGDFGIWPGPAGTRYLDTIDQALDTVDGLLCFVDGNHEDHEQLRRLAAGRPRGARVRVRPGVWWLSRGHRWTWHHRMWLALGGATSVDRLARTPGRNWWPEEALTLPDIEFASRALAQVMVCHDAPSSVPLKLPPAPDWWELEPARVHRKVLQAVVDDVQPGWLLHGHYHYAHDTTVRMGLRRVRVAGLAADGALAGNYRVLNVRTMTWETP